MIDLILHNKAREAKAATLVCIHGWGASADIWSVLASELPEYSVVAVDLPSCGQNTQLPGSFDAYINRFKSVLSQFQAPIYLLGWSLGGQVAAALAAAYHDQVAGLVCVASNPCFVQQDDWLTGMDKQDYASFLARFEDNPGATFAHFNRLQATGAKDLRQLKHIIRDQLKPPSMSQVAGWSELLSWLGQDMRPQMASFAKPQLHILATEDALVPKVMAMQPYGEVQQINGSHCLPLEKPCELARAVDVFIKTHTEAALDKLRVANAFSDAANYYDAYARVQKSVASQVLNKVMTTDASSNILDLGSGTGALSGSLSQLGRYVVALDIAQGMLQYAKHRDCADGFVAADFEQLPFAEASFDLIVSSLAIQWCRNLSRLFAECSRVLKPNGRIVLATLGPGTLSELKQAWQQVDSHVHVNGFASKSQLVQGVNDSGVLTIEDFQQKTEVCEYSHLLPLLKELKAIGAHNSHIRAPRGLMTKSKLHTLEAAYVSPSHLKSGSDHKAITASYDVFFLTLRKVAFD